MNLKHVILGLTRISLGWIFFWPFLDKLFGLGFATCRNAETGVVTRMCERAWLTGGSPTTGFLTFGTHGPFASAFQTLAGNAFVDWLFMVGLLAIGVSLLLGILTRIAVWSGVAMLVLMYLAAWPPTQNPFLDDHLVYPLVLLSFLFMPVGEWLGIGAWWARATKKNPWLR